MNENEVMTTETTETEQAKPKKSGRHLTPEEQLQRVEEKQKALAARAAAIRQKIANKERAHRLILIGAVVEAVAGATVPETALPKLEALFREHRADIVSALGLEDTDQETSVS